MRAPQHFVGHRHRVHLMASKKQGNFLECCIVPDIAALSEPPTQRDRFGIRREDDGDSHLADMSIVRSIEGDGTDRIAAKAQFAPLVQPLPWLPAQLHRDPSPGANSLMKLRFAL